ncbi:MAG: hypothetical protein JWN03_7022 [Nocardia sp.]|uniref:acyl carrier protein n=1 Tax=Nocardia sp. TaxID=1821 RepID=UPI00260FDF09|nr:acyl carrier protein [Nocardia sp.]MCU1646747.1 hypothetical protein [Nocardia sp.]
MNDLVYDRVSAVFAGIIGSPPARGMATVPADVESWDSLGHIRLVHALEREFDCRLDDDALMPGLSLGGLVVALQIAGGLK